MTEALQPANQNDSAIRKQLQALTPVQGSHVRPKNLTRTKEKDPLQVGSYIWTNIPEIHTLIKPSLSPLASWKEMLTNGGLCIP